MKQTTFEAFSELAARSTFVPVVKEIVADLLTPVSAFLRIAEYSDYAFLLESVEGGEHVGRYSFLGKDPFVLLRSRDGRTIVERAGTTTESPEPFIDVLRKMSFDLLELHVTKNSTDLFTVRIRFHPRGILSAQTFVHRIETLIGSSFIAISADDSTDRPG